MAWRTARPPPPARRASNHLRSRVFHHSFSPPPLRSGRQRSRWFHSILPNFELVPCASDFKRRRSKRPIVFRSGDDRPQEVFIGRQTTDAQSRPDTWKRVPVDTLCDPERTEREQTWHNRHVNHSQLETNIGLIASSFPSKTCTSRLILTSSDDVPGSGVA